MTEKRTVPSTPRTAPSSLGDMRDCQKLELTLPHWRMTKLSGGGGGRGGGEFISQAIIRQVSQPGTGYSVLDWLESGNNAALGDFEATFTPLLKSRVE